MNFEFLCFVFYHLLKTKDLKYCSLSVKYRKKLLHIKNRSIIPERRIYCFHGEIYKKHHVRKEAVAGSLHFWNRNEFAVARVS